MEKLCIDTITYQAKEEYKYYCFFNCFQQIIRSYDDDKYLLYLNASAKFTLIKDEKEISEYKMEGLSFFPNFVNENKNRINYYSYSDAQGKNIFTMMNEKLKKGIPIVLANDSYWYPHTSFFKKTHFMHAFILQECDINGFYNIVDQDYVWNYKGRINKDELSQGMNLANLKNLYRFDVPDYFFGCIENDFVTESLENLIFPFLKLDYFNTRDNIKTLESYFDYIQMLHEEVAYEKVLPKMQINIFDMLQSYKILCGHYQAIFELTRISEIIDKIGRAHV